MGMAILDTGCTASIIGEETAARCIEFFARRGLPEPVELQLPPVQLKGFNAVKSSTRKGLRWTVMIGSLWDLLLPLVPDLEADSESFNVTSEPGPAPVEETPAGTTPKNINPEEKSPEKYNARGQGDRRRRFQTVMKHTRYTQVDVGTHRYPLRMLFGQDMDFALCAYNPRFERIPKAAAVKPLYMRTAFLAPDGSVEISQGSERLPSAGRAPFSHAGACVFAFRYQAPEAPVCDNSVPVKGRSSARQDPKPLKPETRTSKDCGVECRQEEPSSSNLATAGASTKEASICDCCAEQAPNTAVSRRVPRSRGS